MSEVASPSPTATGPAPDQVFAPGPAYGLKRPLSAAFQHRLQLGRGRRSQTTAAAQGGPYLRAILPQGRLRDIALAATLKAAILRHTKSGEVNSNIDIISPSPYLPISLSPHLPPSPFVTPPDLRLKLRRARTGNLILFLVDASGSMAARKRMVAVKGAILSLLLDAYQKRDRVGLITFRGEEAQLLVPPTNSVELAERCLRRLPTGGRTPLAAGLHLANQVLTTYLRREAALTPLLVLITDGRANTTSQAHLRRAALALAQQRLATLILDSEQGYVRLGLARELAHWLNAQYLPLDELRAETIAGQVRQRLMS
jgi:magnesium chelatase subunit D